MGSIEDISSLSSIETTTIQKGRRLPPHHYSLQRQDESSNEGIENEIATSFRKDGFVILDQILDQSQLEQWKEFACQYFKECFETLYQNGHTKAPTHCYCYVDDNNNDHKRQEYVMGHGAKYGFREIVMRSPGRYELSLLDMIRMDDDHNDDDKIENICSSKLPGRYQSLIQPLQTLIPKLFLGANDDDDENNNKLRSLSDLKLCHLSLLTSTSGSIDQGWHADGGHANITKHLPCHVLNIFIPLQDVPTEMGPTEFRPGGHYLTRNLGPMMLAAKCRKTLKAPVSPPLRLGDVAIFDYRVLHRGRANTTQDYRDVLVLTYCEPWFEDILNFPKRTMKEPAPATTTKAERSKDKEEEEGEYESKQRSQHNNMINSC